MGCIDEEELEELPCRPEELLLEEELELPPCQPLEEELLPCQPLEEELLPCQRLEELLLWLRLEELITTGLL